MRRNNYFENKYCVALITLYLLLTQIYSILSYMQQ